MSSFSGAQDGMVPLCVSPDRISVFFTSMDSFAGAHTVSAGEEHG
jgi:hypothetical protein